MQSYMQTPHFPGKALKNDAHFLFGATEPLPYIHTYCQNDTEIVHGPSCKIEQEIFTDICAQNQVPIIRRRGGGGTVVLSEGMLILLCVGTRGKQESITDIFSRIHRPLISLLQNHFTIPLTESGISDLALHNKKVCGSSLYLGKRPLLYYYQASIMVHPDLSLLDTYLAHPPREPDYRGNRPHRDFCTTLKNNGYPITCAELKQCLDTQYKPETI